MKLTINFEFTDMARAAAFVPNLEKLLSRMAEMDEARNVSQPAPRLLDPSVTAPMVSDNAASAPVESEAEAKKGCGRPRKDAAVAELLSSMTEKDAARNGKAERKVGAVAELAMGYGQGNSVPLEDGYAAVAAETEAKKGRGRPRKDAAPAAPALPPPPPAPSAPAAQEKPVTQAPAASFDEEVKHEAKAVTIADVQQKWTAARPVIEKNYAGGLHAAAADILKKLGAAKFSAIKPEQFAIAIELLELAATGTKIDA